MILAQSAAAAANTDTAAAAVGVHIGINYAGVVQLFGNAFAGPQSQAIYSETHNRECQTDSVALCIHRKFRVC